MHYSNGLTALLLASCLVGAASCSDGGGDSAESNLAPPYGGELEFGGGPGAGGSATASAGAGSSSAGAPADGVAGSGESGAAPEAAPDAPDPDVEPADAEEPTDVEEPPDVEVPTDVGFSDVFAVLQDTCSPCHAMTGGQLPAFAQDDEDAAYQVTQEESAYVDELYADRIVERALVSRTMPPGCFGGELGTSDCMNVEDAALLEAWIDQGAPP